MLKEEYTIPINGTIFYGHKEEIKNKNVEVKEEDSKTIEELSHVKKEMSIDEELREEALMKEMLRKEQSLERNHEKFMEWYRATVFEAKTREDFRKAMGRTGKDLEESVW